jgi:hypothetical protein
MVLKHLNAYLLKKVALDVKVSVIKVAECKKLVF